MIPQTATNPFRAFWAIDRGGDKRLLTAVAIAMKDQARLTKRLFLFSVVVACAHQWEAIGRGSERQLALDAADANRVALQSIDSLMCRVTVTANAPTRIPLPSAEYWRRGDGTVRLRTDSGGQIVDLLTSGTQIRTFSKSGDSGRGSIVAPGTALGPCDVWAVALCSVPGRDFQFVELRDLIDSGAEIKRAMRVREDNKDLIHMELVHSHGRLRVWLDPAVNYMICRTINTAKHNSQDLPKHEKRVQRFVEVAPAVFFPQIVAAQDHRDGLQSPITTYNLERLRINEQIDASVFRLSFPPGTVVTDTIAGKVYRTNNRGEQIPVKDLELTSASPFPVTAGDSDQTVTTQEPKGLVQWVLPISLVILLVGLSLLVIRRLRRGERQAN